MPKKSNGVAPPEHGTLASAAQVIRVSKFKSENCLAPGGMPIPPIVTAEAALIPSVSAATVPSRTVLHFIPIVFLHTPTFNSGPGKAHVNLSSELLAGNVPRKTFVKNQ